MLEYKFDLRPPPPSFFSSQIFNTILVKTNIALVLRVAVGGLKNVSPEISPFPFPCLFPFPFPFPFLFPSGKLSCVWIQTYLISITASGYSP